jgi:cephalosporin hydroxylase
MSASALTASNSDSDSQAPRKLVLYSYFETPEYRENLRFFVQHGLTDDGAHFIIIVNGGTCSVPVPERPNVSVLRRENVGLDFGAWNHALATVDLGAFDAFLLINCTVRGPFLPLWNQQRQWTRSFTDLLDEETKLVGTTVNYHHGFPHIQSMVLCLDHVSLRIAYDKGIFGSDVLRDWADIVREREVALSQAVLAAGLKIRSLMTAYGGVDWRQPQGMHMAANKGGGDPLVAAGYFGLNIHPYEVIFIKANRGIDDLLLEQLTDWHDGRPPRGPLGPDSPQLRHGRTVTATPDTDVAAPVEPIDRVFHRQYYEAQGWDRNTFKGYQIKQCPFDLHVYQELLFRLPPRFIVQTGVAGGGSLLYLASLMDQCGAPDDALVIGVDLTLTAAARQLDHPRIRLVEGSSTEAHTISQVEALLPSGPGHVSLDSDHRQDHVAAELRIYSEYVAPDHYLIVEDTNVNGRPVYPEHGPGPYEALQDFLAADVRYEIDSDIWQNQPFSFHHWLRRVQ